MSSSEGEDEGGPLAPPDEDEDDSSTAPPPTFESLGLDPNLCEACRQMGYKAPTPIQVGESAPPCARAHMSPAWQRQLFLPYLLRCVPHHHTPSHWSLSLSLSHISRLRRYRGLCRGETSSVSRRLVLARLQHLDSLCSTSCSRDRSHSSLSSSRRPVSSRSRSQVEETPLFNTKGGGDATF